MLAEASIRTGIIFSVGARLVTLNEGWKKAHSMTNMRTVRIRKRVNLLPGFWLLRHKEKAARRIATIRRMINNIVIDKWYLDF
jgi:hypothetical protein